MDAQSTVRNHDTRYLRARLYSTANCDLRRVTKRDVTRDNSGAASFVLANQFGAQTTSNLPAPFYNVPRAEWGFNQSAVDKDFCCVVQVWLRMATLPTPMKAVTSLVIGLLARLAKHPV